MAVSNYASSTIAKGALAALGKVSTTALVLTVGAAVTAVVAGAVLVAQMASFDTWEFETSQKEPKPADIEQQ